MIHLYPLVVGVGAGVGMAGTCTACILIAARRLTRALHARHDHHPSETSNYTVSHPEASLATLDPGASTWGPPAAAEPPVDIWSTEEAIGSRAEALDIHLRARRNGRGGG